ncbi:MAG: hypothetical protein NTV71_01695 [Candidatus Omnitrophica bacterium]|nr:hypothetical protein [Candidatus Omnitrophota bacterium]
MRKIFKKNNTKIRFTNAFKDMVVIATITILIAVLAYFFNAFVFIVGLFQKHPKAITYIDEIITLLLTLSIGFAIFSWRRWIELKKETSECIRLQEELIRVAHTKAETERIISRQLHHEIELRKQLEKDLNENNITLKPGETV